MPAKEFAENQEIRPLSSRVYGTLIFLLLAVYFRFIGGTWLIHINSYYYSVLNTVIIFLIILTWIIWKTSKDKEISLTGFDSYLALLVLVIIISTIAGDNLSLSSEMSVGAIALVFSIYIVLDIKKHLVLWKSLIDALLITGALNVVLMLARVYWWMGLFKIKFVDLFLRPAYVWKIIPRLPDLPNLNANVTAAYLLLLLPIIVFKALSAHKNVQKVNLWVFAFFTLTVLILTKSRGGYIGLVISLLAVVVIYRKAILGRIKKYPTLSFLVIGGVGLAAIFGAIVVFQSRGLLLGASMIGRIEGWRIALEILVDKPLFGTGLGGYGLSFLRMRDPSVYSFLLFHAHNELLNIATSLGLVGLLVILMIIWQIVRIVKKGGVNLLDIRGAYLISLAGFVGMGLVDSYFDSSNIVLLVIIIVVGLLPDGDMGQISINNLITGLVILCLLFLAAFDIYANWKLSPYHDTRTSVIERDLPRGLESIDEAIQRDPNNIFYKYVKAQITGEIICRQESDPTPGIKIYQEILPWYENWGLVNVNAASLYSLNGDTSSARLSIQNGIVSDPEEPLYYCLLGDNLLSAGLYEKAINSFATCLSIDASWVDTPYWQSDQRKMEALEDVILAIADRPAVEEFISLAETLFYLDRLDEVKEEVLEKLSSEEYQPELGIIYSRYLIENDQIDKAITDLLMIIEDNPRDSEAWLVLSKGYLAKRELTKSLSAINISIALESTPENFLLSGLIYSMIGEQGLAKEQYSRALNWKSLSSRNSAWTARRFPIELERLSCSPQLLTIHDFYDVAWQGLLLLEQSDCQEAKKIYKHIEKELFPGFVDMYGELPNSCGD
jgi:tetratricopeptide (TPR) repeat protein/O-antigen ligase